MIRVVVVGGGPAGLAAAIHAARAGARVTVLERNDQCGVKFLATGGGHCNVSNTRPIPEWPALFGKRGRFIVPALNLLPTEKLTSWFREMGVPLACPDAFHFFPVSNSARSVRDALLAEALRLGVMVRTGCRADGLGFDEQGIAKVMASAEEIACDAAVIATGGKSLPASGSTGDGWKLAESAGHRIRRPVPGLIGLVCANLDADLAGLVLPAAEVFFKPRGEREISGGGELLLTHRGVSGPAVLDLSAFVAEALYASPRVEVRLNWNKDLDAAFWLDRFTAWRGRRGAAAVASLLGEYIPQRLARWLCKQAGADGTAKPATLRAAARDNLARFLGGYPALVTGTEGWDKAMITRGGVDVTEINPKTLESRVRRGLYFAGEAVDMDGPCGGYNLHWAFASGALAGRSAAGAPVRG